MIHCVATSNFNRFWSILACYLGNISPTEITTSLQLQCTCFTLQILCSSENDVTTEYSWKCKHNIQLKDQIMNFAFAEWIYEQSIHTNRKHAHKKKNLINWITLHNKNRCPVEKLAKSVLQQTSSQTFAHDILHMHVIEFYQIFTDQNASRLIT